MAAHARRRLVDQAVIDVVTARKLLDGSLGLIADCLAGHPQAARYDGRTTQEPRLWCFSHERDHRRCEHDGLSCGGTPIMTVDPTGDAGTSVDSAAAAQATIDKAIVSMAIAAQTLAVELTTWAPPSQDMQRTDPSALTAPDGWCTSCWRDNRTHEPIGIRPGGSAPYYAGLCEWCGRFKKAQGYLPPLELLRKRHSANPRISEADVARYKPRRS